MQPFLWFVFVLLWCLFLLLLVEVVYHVVTGEREADARGDAERQALIEDLRRSRKERPHG